ncbi:hypothetical protein SARC_16893, partial [Sphaeroforma arctica JP610]
QDTILPTLHHITEKYSGKPTKTFDRLYTHDSVRFDEGDVVMVRYEGRTTKAMRPLFGPYVVKSRIGQRYELANKDGSAPPEFKDRPVRVDLLRLVHRRTDPPLNDELWTKAESSSAILSHTVRMIILGRWNTWCDGAKGIYVGNSGGI